MSKNVAELIESIALLEAKQKEVLRGYDFQLLFNALEVIATPMHRANDTELSLLDRVFERICQRMVAALYAEVG